MRYLYIGAAPRAGVPANGGTVAGAVLRRLPVPAIEDADESATDEQDGDTLLPTSA